MQKEEDAISVSKKITVPGSGANGPNVTRHWWVVRSQGSLIFLGLLFIC